MARSFVFVTDLHITSNSRVRSGDVVKDLKDKLQYVVDYCNANDAILLIGGDLFDKPSVPDYVKSELAPVLRSAKHIPIAVSGNHDRLYDNPEFNFKTSYNVWDSHGLIKSIDNDFVDLGDVIITGGLPIKTEGKLHIALYHGFLNQEDGRSTLRFDDIQTEDQTYILLGHDHVEYEPLQYKDNIKIFRPGSFLRGIRHDAQYRNPMMLHIRVTDKLQYKMVPIKCRDFNEIFKTKEAKVTKSQKESTYEDIINQIRNAAKGDLSFEEAISQVADPEVVEYSKQLLNQAIQENSNKRQNL